MQSGEAGLLGKNAEHFYTESEVDVLIDDLTVAAEEAIEQAAAEAARAAALASLERETSLLQAKELAIREVAHLQANAMQLQGENRRLKQSRIKTAIITGVICFFGGLAIGAGGIAILQGVR